MIHLSTIGQISIAIGDTRISPANQQVFCALLYLVTERGRPIARKQLSEIFFPDSTEDAANHSLRQLVYRLRKLGAPLEGTQATVLMPLEAATWDVESLLTRDVALPNELESLTTGYLEDFLPRHTESFDRWLDDHRTQVKARLRQIIVRQLHAERAKRRFRELDLIARACLALDPLNEEATLAAAESLAMCGSKAEALILLDAYIKEIGARSRDLRIAPRLLRERIAHYLPVVEQETAIIGRNAELATLASLLDQSMTGSVRAAVIWGPSGVGKSRLLNEASSTAVLNGFCVVRARLHTHDTNRPFAILRDLGPGLLDSAGAIGASAETLAAVRGLCGRGPWLYQGIPAGASQTAAVVAVVRKAFVELVDAVSEEQPLVICVEDGQWVDDASVLLLAAILEDRRRVCTFIASQRRVVLPTQIGDSIAAITLQLNPLSTDESYQLLTGLFAQSRRRVDPDFAEIAVHTAGGIPFYLHLLFLNYQTTGDARALADTLSESLGARLARLTELERSVLFSIVVLGSSSSPDRVERVMELPRHSLLQAMHALEDSGLVRLRDGRLTPSHELFAIAARNRMSQGVLRLLHRACAEVLQNEPIGSVEPLSIAAHWDACGQPERAVQIICRAAESYLHLGRPQEALELLAQTADKHISTNLQARIDECRIKAHRSAGQDSQVVEIARRLGLYSGKGSADLQLIAIEALRGAGQPCSQHSDRLLTFARDASQSVEARSRAAHALMAIAEELGDPVLARLTIDGIRDLPEDSSARLRPALIFETVFGPRETALRIAQKLSESIREEGSLATRMEELGNVGHAFWRCGDISNAIDCLTRAHSAATAYKMWTRATAFTSILGDVYWHAGDMVSAKYWLDKGASHLHKSEFPDRGYQQCALELMIALDEGDYDRASALLDTAERLYPIITTNRMRLESTAYRVRIELAKGLTPSTASVDELVRGHLVHRGSGYHDVIADTVVGSLRMHGRTVEALRLRDEYLTVHRRDGFPVPPQLKHLHYRETSE